MIPTRWSGSGKPIIPGVHLLVPKLQVELHKGVEKLSQRKKIRESTERCHRNFCLCCLSRLGDTALCHLFFFSNTLHNDELYVRIYITTESMVTIETNIYAVPLHYKNILFPVLLTTWFHEFLIPNYELPRQSITSLFARHSLIGQNFRNLGFRICKTMW